MTITITWQLVGSVVLAALIVWLASALLVMSLWNDSTPAKVAGLTVTAIMVVGALLLVCAGGGWL